MRALAAPTLFLLAGWPLAALLLRARGRGRRGIAHALGFAYPLGIAWVGTALYALSHVLDVPLRRVPILVVALAPAAIALGALAVRRARERRSSPRGEAPAVASATADGTNRVAATVTSKEPRAARPWGAARWLGLAAFAAAALVSLAVLSETATNPFSAWDDRAIWAAQARHVRFAGTVDVPALRQPFVAIEHPRYPLLLPVAQAAVLEVFGTRDERTARCLYAWFLPAFLLVLHGEARRRIGAKHFTGDGRAHAPLAGPAGASLAGASAAAAVLVAVLLRQLTFESDGGAVSGYSDLPLGVLWGGAVLLLSTGPRGRGASFAAALLLAAVVLAKDEGLVLAGVALAALAIRPLRSAWRVARSGRARRRRAALVRMLPALLAPAAAVALAALLLASWRAGIPARLEGNFDSGVSPALLAKGIAARYPLLFVAMLKEMQRPERWGLFFLTAPLVLYLGRRALVARRGIGPLLALAGALVSYGAGYAVTRLNPFSLVLVTWSRFLTQVALVLLVLFAVALAEALARPRAGLGLVPVAALCLFTPVTTLAGIRWGYSDVGLGATEETALAPEQLVTAEPAGLPPPVDETRADESLPAAIDEPAEGAVVSGELVVRGWSQTPSSRGEVLAIEVDGRVRAPSGFSRHARPDVAHALPRLGACELAGFEARLAPLADDAGARELTVRFLGPGGVRVLRRRFNWKP